MEALQILVVSVVFVGVVAGNELVTMRTHYPAAVSRKVSHVLCALIVCIAAQFMSFRLFAIVGAIFLPIMIRFRYRELRSLADRSESSIGEVLFPVGVALAALLPIERKEFVVCVLLMGLSDTAAYAAGKWLKRPTLLFGKTLPGTAAFFLSALAICLAAGMPKTHAAAVAAVGAAVEHFGPYGTDNATVPPLAGLVILLL
ncbi:MAG: hypothetical protein LBR44_12245 [Clostridiales Family XIII bacterium]|jgi:dolichol kinase|nr:hypothetical protein [Clostridiales Family XIII bacterium]